MERDIKGDEQPTLAISEQQVRTQRTRSAERSSGGRVIFASGDVVAARYRIVRFVARGGMGEVYEADDTVLRERVALKTIRAEIVEEQHVVERFKREINLARKISHPNVCRLFDIGSHQFTGPLASEITFLTMEFLPGETLEELLRREGRMDAAEALPLVRQMTDALLAAHRVGIVHRDFKSANVMLVPAPGTDGETRVVVTDFGLARGSGESGESRLTTLTDPGNMVGTPAYIAPEQLEGKPVSAATDIYALGVVLYEMVTGTFPFNGDTPMVVALKRLHEAPLAPRTHAPDLAATWEQVILRCLARDPAERFQSATDVTRALGGELVPPSDVALERERQRSLLAQRSRQRRLTLGAVAALALLVCVFAGYKLRGARWLRAATTGQQTAGAVLPVRRSVALLGFKNLSGRADNDWLSAALAEMLATELAAGEKLRIVPSENVARMKMELAIADATRLAPDTLARVRTNLDADYVVLGTYTVIGTYVRLDLRLQNAATGEDLAFISDMGDGAQLFDLVAHAGLRLREALGVATLTPTEASLLRASLPANPEAARLYSEGRAKLNAFDALAARELLERAVAADPKYPLSYSALAAAWVSLGYDAKARDAAQQAFDLSGTLSREERLAVEGRYRETLHDSDKAIEIYRTLFEFFPDTLDYGLRLATVQTNAGRAPDALATVTALRRLPPPAAADPRIDMAEALVADGLSDYKREQTLAAEAAAKGVARSELLIVAEARYYEGWAFWNLGDNAQALAAYADAQRLYDVAGKRIGVADIQSAIANVRWRQGDYSEALKLYGAALAIKRELGQRKGIAAILNNIANVYNDQGKLADARRNYEESLVSSRETGDKTQLPSTLFNLAGVLKDQGDLASAKRMFAESLQIAREIGRKSSIAIALQNSADLNYLQGDLPTAQQMGEESLAAAREIGRKNSVAYSLRTLGDVLMAKDDLAGARRQYAEALAIRQEIDEEGTTADSRLTLAALALEENQPADAEQAARAAAEEFEQQKAQGAIALANALLARALAAQHKLDEAQQLIRHATELTARDENVINRLAVAINVARVQLATGHAADASRNLAAANAEAARRGLTGLQLEARLALAESKLATGHNADAHADLAQLDRDATAKGFNLIARKAAALKQ
jgi:tetratricopeptide (TPR) repeat protein/tRNA A-37 threonylcarbamoyl transferase component Bud32